MDYKCPARNLYFIFDDAYDTRWNDIFNLYDINVDPQNYNPEDKSLRFIYHYKGNTVFERLSSDCPKTCWNEVFVVGKNEKNIIKMIKECAYRNISKKEAQKIMTGLSVFQTEDRVWIDNRFIEEFEKKVKDPIFEIMKEKEVHLDLPLTEREQRKFEKFREFWGE